MAGGGGKGGSQTQSTEIDPALTAAARDALDMAAAAASIPYSPNRGVQIAAFTPQQNAAMQGVNNAAASFGMQKAKPVQMPEMKTSASGIQGYSTGEEYDSMLEQSMSPELRAAIDGLFADRETGKFDGPGKSPLFRGAYAAMPGIERAGGK